jgi:hypothetical protein
VVPVIVANGHLLASVDQQANTAAVGLALIEINGRPVPRPFDRDVSDTSNERRVSIRPPIVRMIAGVGFGAIVLKKYGVACAWLG